MPTDAAEAFICEVPRLPTSAALCAYDRTQSYGLGTTTMSTAASATNVILATRGGSRFSCAAAPLALSFQMHRVQVAAIRLRNRAQRQ